MSAKGLHASAIFKVARDRVVAALGDAAADIPANLRSDLLVMKEEIEEIVPMMDAAAERQSMRSTVTQVWLRQLEAAAYDTWDMVDKIQANKGAISNKSLKMAKMLRPSLIPAWVREMIARLKEIRMRAQRYNFLPDVDTHELDRRETSSHLEEGILIVGRDEEKQRILDLLSSPGGSDGREEWPVFLPIFGIAGLGKTTLAAMVFNHTAFQGYTKVWIHVSLNFDLMRIARSIIEGITSQPYDDENLGSMELTYRRLDELLGAGHNFLIVLDDMWEEEDSKLDELKRMLEGVNDQRRNKLIVIVTTHDEGIARKICGKNVKPLKLHPLSDDLCWEIIKQTSGFEDRTDNLKLGKIGTEIATRCGGIPLAAQALGHKLEGKSINEWSEVRSTDAIWDSSLRDTLFSSLELSYKSMPPDMRLCFAFLGTSPDMQNIAKDDLIHKWIALGLIDPCGGISTGQQRGEYIISRLLDISFLRLSYLASTSGKDDKGMISFTMHSLVHSFARSAIISKLVVVNGENRTSAVGTEYCRYAVFANFDITQLKLSGIFPAELWALSLLGCVREDVSDYSFSCGKYLRLLEMREPSMQKLPGSICLLRLLGYLNLSGCSGLQQLPDSLGSLSAAHQSIRMLWARTTSRIIWQSNKCAAHQFIWMLWAKNSA